MKSNNHIENSLLNHEDIRRFSHAMSPFTSSYRSIQKKSLLIKENDEYYAYFSIIALSPKPIPSNEYNVILDNSPYLVVEEISQVQDMDTIIGQVIQGIITINESRIKIKNIGENTEIHYRDVTPDSSLYWGIEPRTYMLSIEPPADHNFFRRYRDRFDEVLRTNPIPFDGAYRLGQEFFQLYGQYNIPWHRPFVILFAPVPMGLENDTFYTEEGLTIHLWADEALEFNTIQIATADYEPDGQRSSRSIGIIDLNEADQVDTIKHFQNVIKNTREIVSSDVYLSYQHRFILKYSFFNPFYQSTNIGLSAIETIDQGLNYLTKTLNGEYPKSFERGISLLFGLSGFITLGLGEITGLTDFADLVVLDPYHPRGLIIECTTDHLDKNNKMDRFIRRVELIKPLFRDYSIIPVMVTSLSKDKLNDIETNEARENEIIIFTSEDIETLFEAVKQDNAYITIIDLITSNQYGINPGNRVR